MKLTHWFFQKTYNSKPLSQWCLSHKGQILLETGSSVKMLRELHRRKLVIPSILGGPSAFDREYSIEWGHKKAALAPRGKVSR